ncbi:hypothetical protein G9A89_011363 [Geosiphon pyriformis]|nr:hypothetical protein G9A89_011363 [Geosiphon pyriformis]
MIHTCSTTSKKKASKSAFHGLASGFFSQKKKVILSNVKHSGNEKDISLSKFGSGNHVYSNVKSLFGENEDVSMFGVNGESLLGSAVTTLKAKQVNTGAGFGFPLSSSNFYMDDDKVVLLFHLPIFLEKKWIDPKIIKTFVEVLVKKSFTLDINLSAVEGKLAMAKTQLIWKIFSTVNGFGGATTPLKFEEIIQSTFTSEESLIKTTLLARKEGIIVNSNLKKQEIHSNWAVVIKKISMNTPKNIIIAALTEFGEIKSIKIQLIELWQKAVMEFAELDQVKQLATKWSFLIGKDSVCVAMAVDNCKTWASKDKFRVLLFTLLVRTTAYDLNTLLDGAGEKTCVINCSMDSGNQVCCAVVGFESEEDLESAYHTELIFGSVKLSWTRLDLVCCEKCEHFGHSTLECDAPISPIFKSSRSVKRVSSEDHHLQLAKLYAKKSVLISKPAVFGGKSWTQVVSLASPSSGPCFDSGFGFGSPPSGSSSIKKSALVVSNIVHRLNGVELVPLVLITQVVLLATPVSTLVSLDTDMVLDVPWLSLLSSSPVLENKVVDLGLSSLKVFTFKVGSLESKMIALKIMNKFNGLRVFTSGLDIGFYGTGHVSKMNEISGHLISVHLLFKNKLSVTILDLYTGVFISTQFSQAADINSMISKVVNSSLFVVLDGDFNKNKSGKSVSFKFCLELGLVNTFDGHSLIKASTWSNSRDVEKVIDFIFVSGNLASVMASHFVDSVSEFFDTDHKSVFISIGLGGLLNAHLISICRQANQDHFKDCSSTKLLARSDMFEEAKVNELLVVKIVKYWNSGDLLNFTCLIKVWSVIDVVKASKVDSMVLNGVSLMELIKHLLVIRKGYHKSKYCESKIAEDTAIRKAINRHMKNFCSDKEKIIKNILEHPFHKVVLDHLVVDNELVIEPNKVKLKTRKQLVLSKMPDLWTCQYMPLNYVNDDAFSDTMNKIGMEKLSLVIDNLPNNKAAKLSGIPNEL